MAYLLDDNDEWVIFSIDFFLSRMVSARFATGSVSLTKFIFLPQRSFPMLRDLIELAYWFLGEWSLSNHTGHESFLSSFVELERTTGKEGVQPRISGGADVRVKRTAAVATSLTASSARHLETHTAFERSGRVERPSGKTLAVVVSVIEFRGGVCTSTSDTGRWSTAFVVLTVRVFCAIDFLFSPPLSRSALPSCHVIDRW